MPRKTAVFNAHYHRFGIVDVKTVLAVSLIPIFTFCGVEVVTGTKSLDLVVGEANKFGKFLGINNRIFLKII